MRELKIYRLPTGELAYADSDMAYVSCTDRVDKFWVYEISRYGMANVEPAWTAPVGKDWEPVASIRLKPQALLQRPRMFG